MALPTSYMTGNFKKIPTYFETIINAQAPEKFTVKFLKDLGFTSSADLQFINVLKSLGFLDDSGVPTESYYGLFDPTKAKKAVAEGIKNAYSDLFTLNKNSQNMTKDELKGKFKSLTNGQKSDSTIKQMVSTFIALCEYADFTSENENHTILKNQDKMETEPKKNSEIELNTDSPSTINQHKPKLGLSYDIHIHLPATRDERVYDALFSSLTKHLM